MKKKNLHISQGHIFVMCGFRIGEIAGNLPPRGFTRNSVGQLTVLTLRYENLPMQNTEIFLALKIEKF